MDFLLILLILSFTSEINDGYTNCTSRPVKEGYNECLIIHKSNCTAEEGTPVDLVCASCPPGFQGIRWFMWNLKDQQYQLMPEYNGTGTIHFDKVRDDQTDCYKCSCPYRSANISALIGLQVNHPGKPHLANGKGHWIGPNAYRLPTVRTNLTVHDKGRVCIDAKCTGTTPLTYTWYRNDSTGVYILIDTSNFEDAKCDSGIQLQDNPDSHLCILPTIRELCVKGDTIQQYMVNVSNENGRLSIVVYANVEFPDMNNDGCSWFMRPHEKQSYGSITINGDGTGTAYCVAYHENRDENINFYLCKIDSSKNGLSACYFQDLQIRNQCINCTSFGGIQESNITCSVKPVTNHMGMHSRGCVVTFSKPEKEQMYSCIARREISTDRVSSSLQGPELSDPQEIGTFQFVDPVLLTNKEIEEIFIPAIFLLLCLLAVIAIAGFIFYKYRKKKKDYRELEREIRQVQPRPDGVIKPRGGGGDGDSPESSLYDSHSATTESSFLLSSCEHLRNYKSADSEAATKRSKPIPIEASGSSSVESFTGSITDSQSKSKVAEIDLESCASSTPSSKNSMVVSLPPGKQYDFTLGRNGKKISIYTDFVRQSPPQNILDGAVPLPDHIEEIVPISMPVLLDFVDSMASCWDRIGIKLGLEDKVAELRRREAFPSSHLIMLLEVWLQSGKRVSWARLVDVLENPAVNMGTVAANIKDFLIKQVPKIPDNIDFLVPMSVPNLMHLVASFAQHWETIGQLLKLKEEVEKLKKAPYTSYVKMTLVLESWATLKQEFSWLNLLEECEGQHELRPLVADIRQHLLKKMRELYKPTSAGKD